MTVGEVEEVSGGYTVNRNMVEVGGVTLILGAAAIATGGWALIFVGTFAVAAGGGWAALGFGD